MKIFVGIDIAKLNHFAAAISSDGEILIEPFKFTNDADGFQLLVSKLELNNPVPVSLLSGDRKPQIRFLGNHHSGSGNLYHKSFRM